MKILSKMNHVFSSFAIALLVAPMAAHAQNNPISIDDLIERGDVKILAASDVSQAYIDMTKQWLEIGANEWFLKDGDIADDRYYPLIVTMVHRDVEAAAEVTEALCDEIRENNYSQWLCRNHFAGDEHGNPLVDGVASISSYRGENGFHFMMIGTASRWRRDDFAEIILHELFHVYQLSQFTTKDGREADRLMGKRSGDFAKDVPWWSEGTATLMARTTYAEHANKPNNYVRNLMACQLGDCRGRSSPMIRDYFRGGQKLYNIGWEDNSHMGYQLGALFAAYLINDVGVDKVFEFYQSVDRLGFDTAFEATFSKPHRDYIDEFETYIQSNRINSIVRELF